MEGSSLINHPERYRLLFENSSEGMVIFGKDGTILEANQHVADMVGYEINEMIGRNVLTFSPEEESKHTFGRVQKVNAGQIVPITECTIIRKDGSTFQGNANISPIRDVDDNLLFIFGVIRDLTDRKQQQEKDHLLLLLDTLDGVCFIKDRNGIYKYVNRAFETQLGVKREDLIGKDDTFVFGPNAEALQENDRRIMASKKPEAVEESGIHNNEFMFYLTNKTPLIDEFGEVTGICGVGVDITKQKLAEKALHESIATTRALLNASIDLVMLTKPDGTIVALNQAAANTLGRPVETLIGQNALDFFPPDLAQERRSQAEAVVKSGTPKQFEDTRDGKWFRNQIYPIFDEDGGVSQLAIYAHDITDVQYKAVEEERIRIARELHDSVTQTMYSVSIVAEALPRLLDRDPGEARRRAVHLRQMTLGALAEMRNLLFEFHPQALKDTDLNILIQQLSDVLTGHTRIPVDLAIDGEMQLPEDVKIVFYRIAQEAFNNIIKHAEATLVSTSLISGADGCRLTIHDNGRGFDPNIVKSEKLGLKFMCERAEEIYGDLVVESSPNQGTRISLVWSGLLEEGS